MRQECDSCTTTRISVMAFTLQGNLITKLVIRGTSWLSQMSSRGVLHYRAKCTTYVAATQRSGEAGCSRQVAILIQWPL